ncbi:TetR/AcrR family transcriptional regulator [Methyloligella sp. 2.7D]|uniref:TetR/AcrR family transcriptional regulator n=1 Tax=unclassified Methyloligella TaxID=2625955 RepID=UPI00157C927A|nr:TetR/AcrR family transcriptional regulator [Methyloligella sp. GL2]QKP78013.1 TetR/AcrR family transcriptional regulator [Methyloligella sp. GL2]
MGPSDRDWRRARGYHHGNLKETLLEAARTLIERHGPVGFSLAEAARLAGVSPAAPYRHFRDRDALLSEVARTGFERFAARLETAWDNGRPTPLQAFENLGRAYLAFAREEPAAYAVMFETALGSEHGEDGEGRAGRIKAADHAFDILQKATAALCEPLDPKDRPPVRLVALHVWALSHGVATLLAENRDERRKVPVSPEEVLESGILIYLKGLGILDAGSEGKPA